MATQRAEVLLAAWLPDGRRVNGEWVALNPRRDDKTPGSFRINVETGVWADFASNDKGGDLVDLYAFLNSCDLSTAMREVAAQIGATGWTEPPPARPRTADPWTPVAPIPAEALDHRPDSFPDGETKFPIVRWWNYTDESGCPMFCIGRFEKPAGKEIRPACWCCNSETGETAWRWKSYPAPRPLYNRDRLAANPEAGVILTEGEKCADALTQILPDPSKYVVTTWSGGAQAVKKTDFSPLTGRRVLCWPDHDAPGLKAMQAVCALLAGKADALKILRIPDAMPAAWDAADALAAGPPAARLVTAPFVPWLPAAC